jgi:phospholipid/cholesterol/gamma-HCH transport system substrate-binding protein
LKNNFQEIANSSAITMKNLEQSTSENGDLHETLENMNQISSSLADNDQQIEKILHNINSLTANLSEINYSQSVRKLDSTTTKLNQLLAGMNSGRGTAGKLMTDDSLYINLNNLTYSLDLLINDMKDNPKKYVHFSIFGKDNE